MKKVVLFLFPGILIASCGTTKLKKDLQIENFAAPPK